jgi:hypothetical protein
MLSMFAFDVGVSLVHSQDERLKHSHSISCFVNKTRRGDIMSSWKHHARVNSGASTGSWR